MSRFFSVFAVFSFPLSVRAFLAITDPGKGHLRTGITGAGPHPPRKTASPSRKSVHDKLPNQPGVWGRCVKRQTDDKSIGKHGPSRRQQWTTRENGSQLCRQEAQQQPSMLASMAIYRAQSSGFIRTARDAPTQASTREGLDKGVPTARRVRRLYGKKMTFCRATVRIEETR